jgi:putative PIN family toxin of toxin-antitoxin system
VRIALDTNVYISVFVFQSERLGQMLNFIGMNHQIVMSSCVLDELREVVEEKFPAKTATLDAFLASIPFEYFYSPKILPDSLDFEIRDNDDAAVLYSAILSDSDILITGDRDFFDIAAKTPEKPAIMTPTQFMERYMN